MRTFLLLLAALLLSASAHAEGLAGIVTLAADDQAALQQVIDYYHDTLKRSPEALDYLRARGIAHPEAVERFRLGYANRTLSYGLPGKAWKEGGRIRGQLAKIGRASCRERVSDTV